MRFSVKSLKFNKMRWRYFVGDDWVCGSMERHLENFCRAEVLLVKSFDPLGRYSKCLVCFFTTTKVLIFLEYRVHNVYMTSLEYDIDNKNCLQIVKAICHIVVYEFPLEIFQQTSSLYYTYSVVVTYVLCTHQA